MWYVLRAFSFFAGCELASLHHASFALGKLRDRISRVSSLSEMSSGFLGFFIKVAR
jgi:hypothetical protein